MTRARRVPRKEFKLFSFSFIYRRALRTPTKCTVEGQSTRRDYVVFLRVAPQDPPALNLKSCPKTCPWNAWNILGYPFPAYPFNTLGNRKQSWETLRLSCVFINSLIWQGNPSLCGVSFPCSLPPSYLLHHYCSRVTLIPSRVHSN